MSVLTIDVNTDIHQAYRFPAWVALFVFSAICLAAVTSTTEDGRNGKENWVVASSCISMIVAFSASLSYLFVRPKFVGKAIEVGLALLLIVLWSAAWPVIMNIKNGIAVAATLGGGLFIVNANLYFFTWLALGAALYIIGSLAQEVGGLSLVPSRTHARWLALGAASIIVMASAARVLKDTDTCKLAAFSDSEYCRRTRWAIAMGCISTFISIFVLLVSICFTLLLKIELAITSLLLVLWCFGVGYITFGNTPGATISNIYFGAWIAFILTVILFGCSFREYMALRAEEASTDSSHGGNRQTKKAAGNDIEQGEKDETTTSPHKEYEDDDSDEPRQYHYKIGDSDDDDDDNNEISSSQQERQRKEEDDDDVKVIDIPLDEKNDTDPR